MNTAVIRTPLALRGVTATDQNPFRTSQGRGGLRSDTGTQLQQLSATVFHILPYAYCGCIAVCKRGAYYPSGTHTSARVFTVQGTRSFRAMVVDRLQDSCFCNLFGADESGVTGMGHLRRTHDVSRSVAYPLHCPVPCLVPACSPSCSKSLHLSIVHCSTLPIVQVRCQPTSPWSRRLCNRVPTRERPGHTNLNLTSTVNISSVCARLKLRMCAC